MRCFKINSNETSEDYEHTLERVAVVAKGAMKLGAK
jgi:hypothetical protein